MQNHSSFRYFNSSPDDDGMMAFPTRLHNNWIGGMWGMGVALWCFFTCGEIFVEKLLDLGNDKPTIEVGTKDKLLEVTDVCVSG